MRLPRTSDQTPAPYQASANVESAVDSAHASSTAARRLNSNCRCASACGSVAMLAISICVPAAQSSAVSLGMSYASLINGAASAQRCEDAEADERDQPADLRQVFTCQLARLNDRGADAELRHVAEHGEDHRDDGHEPVVVRHQQAHDEQRRRPADDLARELGERSPLQSAQRLTFDVHPAFAPVRHFALPRPQWCAASIISACLSRCDVSRSSSPRGR